MAQAAQNDNSTACCFSMLFIAAEAQGSGRLPSAGPLTWSIMMQMAIAHEERLRLAEQLRLRDRVGASAAGQLGELQAELQQRDAQLQAEQQRVAR